MLRLLLIVALIIYVLSKVSSFLFRAGAPSQNRNFQQRKGDGNVNVNSTPKKEKRGDIKGGDYVDYEEVK